MKAILRKMIGGDRPRVIAVFGATRAEVERSVRHVLASSPGLPVWAWCEENAAPVEGCERFVCGDAAAKPAGDLRSVWPALSIVAWTASGGSASLKLLPLVRLPFRVLVQNEAGDFFSALSAATASHIFRRLRDGIIGAGHRLTDWIRAFPLLLSQIGTFLNVSARRAIGWLHDVRVRSGEVAAWCAFRLGEGLRAAANYGSESMLALLAVLARGTPSLARAIVRRRKGARHLTIDMGPCGASFVEVELAGRGWPRRRILRSLREADADYVVFRYRGEDADAAALVEVARSRNAFAVAKQRAFSHWRPRVATKHPFRRLQDGEVTEVFAPWSSLLVIRRDALLLLGCPRALSSGAAFLALFWKAASAGLVSLVTPCRVASETEVTDEPAMALEDAEFAARLALSPVLGSLGARHPARQRGNVAAMPALARPLTGKPRVLVVSPYLPWPLSHGGAVRIYNLCRELRDEVDFILACFRENGETVHYDKLHEVFREVYVVDADEKRPDPAVPAQVAEYRNSAMADLVRRFCLERRVDLVQLEYTQMAEYRDHTGAVPVLLVEHDITFTLHRQLADTRGDAKTRAEYERWLSFEREALQCSNAVWTMSGSDRDLAIRYGASATGVTVVPNGVDLERYRQEPNAGGAPTILFVGSFRHLPNLMAFEALRERIMPGVWREFPDAVLHVIGGPAHERAAELAEKAHLLRPDSRIRMEGFVSDVRPAYRGADVVAIPLPVSAGTNIKVMEAMACGRAIVSTPVGCQGLDLDDGRDILVADLGDDFALSLNALLKDAALRDRIATEARLTAERRFGWDYIAREAAGSYRKLLESAIPAPVGQLVGRK